MRRLTVLLLALVAASAAAADGAVSPQRAEALERLVRHDCGSCHGLKLTGGLGRDLRTDAVAEGDSDAIAAIILDGVPGTAMPPWRRLLTQSEATWIAGYLKREASR